MTTPPLDQRPLDHIPPFPPTQKSGWKNLEKAFGYVWNTIRNIPTLLYGLVIRVMHTAKGIFAPKDSSPIKPMTQNVKATPLPPPILSPEFTGSPKVNIKEDQKVTLGIMIEEEPVKKEIHEEMKDPLHAMGAITNDSDLIPEELIVEDRVKVSPIEEETASHSDEALSVVQDLVKTAEVLLKKIDEEPPLDLEGFFDYMDSLDNESSEIRRYASDFLRISEKGHGLIQKTMKALEGKRSRLEAEMSAGIKEFYKPNPAIRGDGNCLFLSANDLLKGPGQQFYRKMAADYFRSHSAEVEADIKDAWQRGTNQISDYSKTQGGVAEWAKKLQAKLERTPTLVDYYCDCLENYNLWGGFNELKALSEQLQRPLLLFTPNQKSQNEWKLEVIYGRNELNKPPLLFYYNGVNHYQDLIPK